MTMRTFDYIISYCMFNNSFRNVWEEDVNTTITFLPGPMMVDCGSFETNYSHDAIIFPRDIDMADMSESGFGSDLSSLSGENSKHTSKILSIVME